LKKLIIQLSVFTTLVVLLSVTILYVLREVQLKKTWKVNSSKKHILFIGDSHIEVSVNDHYSNHYYTLAESGDCYLYTFCKFNRFIEANPQFDTIYLRIDCHNIDKTSEEWSTRQSYLDFKFPSCFPYLKNDDIQTLYTLNPIGFIKSIPYLLTVSDKESKTEYLKSFGSYKPIDSVVQLKDLYKELKSEDVNITSDIQFLYLEKIRALCKEKGKVLILITVPIHKSVIRNSVLETKLEQYVVRNNILYLNYRDYNISDDGYSDKFHLNKKGSHEFTN